MNWLALAAIAATLSPPIPLALDTASIEPMKRAYPKPHLVTLQANTIVDLRLVSDLTSKSAWLGQQIPIIVTVDVMQDDLVAIPAGTYGVAEVSRAEKSGMVGKTGKLGLRLLWLDLNGHRIPMTGDRSANGEHNGGVMVSTMVLAGIGGLLIHGHNVTIRSDLPLQGYTVRDEKLAGMLKAD